MMSDPHILSHEPIDATEAAVVEPGPPEDVEVPPLEVEESEEVQHPAKVMRIGAMIKQLLEEIRRAPVDEAGRARLAEIHSSSLEELSASVSPDLRDELKRLTSPFLEAAMPPTEAEIRVAQAQLVGWLEGLFHGIQATLFAQQMEARQQLEQLRQRSLPAGSSEMGPRPGTYL